MNKTISPILWLWIPVIAMVIQIILELSLSGEVLSAMHSENGLHELLEFFILVAAFFVCIRFFFQIKNTTFLLNFWFGFAAICCFYVAGEEISWGQHVWDWSTPEFWDEVNDQQETNFHNTSSWFDQKPRLILILGIVMGTIVAPLLKKYNILKLPVYLDMLLPSNKLIVIALFVVVPQLIEKLFEVFDIVLFARFSEVQELYIFYFVILYLITLKNKIAISMNDLEKP